MLQGYRVIGGLSQFFHRVISKLCFQQTVLKEDWVYLNDQTNYEDRQHIEVKNDR